MEKLETLTQEQEAIIVSIRDKYINNFFSGKEIEKDKVERGIKMIYEMIGKPMLTIIYLDSPLGIQFGANYAKKLLEELNNVRNNVGNNVWNNVGNNVRNNVGNNVWNNVRDNVWNNVWNNVGNNVGNNVWNNVGNNVWNNVWNNVGNNVRDNVRDNVGNNVRDNGWNNSKLEYYTTCSYGNFSDYGWISFYDYFQTIGVDIGPKKEEFNTFKDMILGGVFDMIQLENYVFVSGLPTKVVRDNRGRMHNENGFAIEFRDGFVLNYLQGQLIDYELYPKIINDELTPNEVFAIKNAEVRRIAYEYMDKTKMLQLPGYEVIDEKVDDQGNKMKIIKFDIDEVGEILLYNCFCPSTGREYHLQTKSKTCKEAKSLSFGDRNIKFDFEY